MAAPAVFHRVGSTHTCIRVAVSKTAVHYIPMETLALEKADPATFALTWKEFEDYPVGRAAELYLGTSTYREMSAEVKKHLAAIMADPAYTTEVTLQEDTAMTAPKKTPAPKKTAAKTEDAAKTKATAAAKTPTKTAAAPKKTPAPAKTAAAPKKTAKADAADAKPKKVAAARKPDDSTYVVQDDSSVKRGMIREFVDEAKKRKKFTRDELVAHFEGTWDQAITMRHFYWCTGKGIFALSGAK